MLNAFIKLMTIRSFERSNDAEDDDSTTEAMRLIILTRIIRTTILKTLNILRASITIAVLLFIAVDVVRLIQIY